MDVGSAVSSGTVSASLIAVDDLDGDGEPDFVIATGPDTASVFLNQGSTFSKASDYSMTGPLTSMALRDLNLDGIPDLVLATRDYVDGDYVSWFAGSGAGTFGTRTSFSAGGILWGPPIIGDFNRDAVPDIIYTDDEVDTNAAMLLSFPP